MTDIIFSALALVLGILFVSLAPSRIKPWLNLLAVFAVGVFSSMAAVGVLLGNPIDNIVATLPIFGDVAVRVDALSAWFILIVNFTCLTGAAYGIGYMRAYSERKSALTLHWIYFMVFQSSMLWVCMLQNMLAFLVAWELMSLSSLLLVMFESEREDTQKVGLNYMIQMHLGVAFLTVAFIWVYLKTGSLDMSAIGTFFAGNSNVWLFLLLFIGFGIKAGFIPLHSWLPHAHPAAPSHVSGVMSGVIVKMGIYGIIRVIAYLQTDYMLIGKVLLSISLLTGIFGIVNSAVHRDFKRVLAYCTIENIGIIGIGLGLGLIGLGLQNPIITMIGFVGALLHVLNHSLFKSLLFFTSGSIYQQTHTRDMEKLGGLIKQMPKSAFIFLIGALAIGGMPPFNGFVSEFVIYSGLFYGLNNAGMLHSIMMILSIATLSIIGGASVMAFTKCFGVIFLGQRRSHLHSEPVEVPILMRLPQYIIIVVMMSVALVPSFYIGAAQQVVSTLIGAQVAAVPVGVVGAMTSIGRYSLLFLGIIGVVLAIRFWLTSRQPSSVGPTWGCGYLAPKSSIQYTGKSYSKTLGKLLGGVLVEKKEYDELVEGEVFPKERQYVSHYSDFFEIRIFNGILTKWVELLNKFQFIQNGQLQQYILYGLGFVIAVLICSLFNWL
ncbi:MAG: hypothetical protein MJ069_00795 [Salinivirgaceae bacterium]|nr:hypothetical protein [Salinivirgaceae bacterium]